MEIVMVSGFLGSGKTTVILELAKYLTSLRNNIAFLVNEAGEIPLDGEVIEREGYKVQQLFGGCVCCQVVGDFVAAIKSIVADNKPDVILIEPSGIADPERISSVLAVNEIAIAKQICIVDAVRLTLLLKAARNIVESGIRSAGVVLVNKTDIAGSEQWDELKGLIQNLNPTVDIKFISGKNGIPAGLWEEVMANERL